MSASDPKQTFVNIDLTLRNNICPKGILASGRIGSRIRIARPANYPGFKLFRHTVAHQSKIIPDAAYGQIFFRDGFAGPFAYVVSDRRVTEQVIKS